MVMGIESRRAGVRAPVIDLARERSRTAGCVSRHYLNAAGSALASDAVVDVVVAHLRAEQRIGGYEAAAAARDQVEEAYRAAAELLGASVPEIALFDSATTGLRAVFDGLRLGPGDTVVAPRSSYVSQALRLLQLQRDGVRLVVLPDDETGAVDLDALESALQVAGPAAVISAVHVPTSSGLVEPVERIGELARRHGARYVLDATQSVGQLVTDVKAIGCDVLVTTGRKFLRGPRGTALAYVREGFWPHLTPWAPDVRASVWSGPGEWTTAASARMLETWECAVALRLGLGVAIREAVERGLPATQHYITNAAARLRALLAAIDGVRVVDPLAAASGIVTFTVDGWEARAVAASLHGVGVDVIAIPAAHAQWDLGARGLPGVVRASMHVYNDNSDLDALVDAVASIRATPDRRAP